MRFSGPRIRDSEYTFSVRGGDIGCWKSALASQSHQTAKALTNPLSAEAAYQTRLQRSTNFDCKRLLNAVGDRVAVSAEVRPNHSDQQSTNDPRCLAVICRGCNCGLIFGRGGQLAHAFKLLWIHTVNPTRGIWSQWPANEEMALPCKITHCHLPMLGKIVILIEHLPMTGASFGFLSGSIAERISITLDRRCTVSAIQISNT